MNYYFLLIIRNNGASTYTLAKGASFSTRIDLFNLSERGGEMWLADETKKVLRSRKDLQIFSFPDKNEKNVIT